MANAPCYWTTADNIAHAMQYPDGGGAIFSPVPRYGISGDGTIIVGYVYDADGNNFPAMWINGTLTELPIPDGFTATLDARLISKDGTVIVGISNDGIVAWTDGGTVTTVLPLIAAATNAVGSDINCISDDGTVICGSNLNGTTFKRVAVYWDSLLSGGWGVARALPNARSNSSAFVSDMQAHDASYIFGHTFSTDDNEDRLPLYWGPEGTETEHHLTTGGWNGGTVLSCSNGNSAAVFVPDGGVSGPFPTSNDRYYWTAVDVQSGGYYGTLHQYQLLSGFANLHITAQPKNSGTTAVGSVYNSDGVDNVGCIWNITVPQQLEVPDTLSVPMQATCVGGLGYPIGGYGYTLDLTYRRAGFWNVLDSGHWTTLQVLDENDETLISGISIDGSVIYGYASPAPPSLPSATLAIDDLTVTQYDPPPEEHKVSLRWSDDRGCSWSNPIEQDLGAEGRYETDIQWRRCGMSRDRVLELSWSTDALTSLTGVWIEITYAQT